MNESSTPIRSCPFCGDYGAEVAESSVPSIHGGNKRAVYCNTCFCEGPTSETEDGAVERWNSRAEDQEQVEFPEYPAFPEHFKTTG